MTNLSESLRHYSNLMVLNEGIKEDVKNMFVGMNLQPRDKQWLDQQYDWAKSTFVTRLDDEGEKVRPNKERVMWYMRMVKLHLLEKVIDGSEGNKKIFQKALSKAAHKAGDSTEDIEAGVAYAMRPAFKTEMEHFMSMDIHSIKTMEFAWEAPQKLIAHMKAAEEDWKSDQSAIVEEQPGDEILIDFKDGYAWWNLNRASCRHEADAMGHCGNAGARYGDNILSLRRKVIGADGEDYWSPVATFIIDDDGELGEMKGRFNDKPDEKYHPYIVELLKNPIVEGIKGGGYLPENNFSINDLDGNVYADLIKEKPELRGLGEIYSKDGLTDDLKAKLEKKLDAKGISPNDFEITGDDSSRYGPRVKVEEWDNFESFLRDIDDTALLKILEYYTDGPDLSDATPDDEYYIDVLSALPTKYQQLISEEIGVDITTRNRNDLRDALDTMKTGPREYYRFIEYMNSAITGIVAPEGDVKETIKSRIDEYIEAGFGLTAYHVWVDVDKDNFDKPVEAFISLQDLIYLADSDDSDDEYLYEADQIREYGYTALDSENQRELRGSYNADLIDSDGNDKELKDILNSSDIGYNVNRAVGEFIKLFDATEQRITEEALLADIKRLAGI